jgi:hypothetical protein
MPLDIGRITHLLEQMHRSEDDAGDPIPAGQHLVTDGAAGFTWQDTADQPGVYTVEPQTPHQARLYLMRDGTWRDPFVVGLGTITAGSPATITDDTKYNAWPTTARMTENRIILAYTKGDSHHADNTGAAVIKIGTEDGDGSITWGSEITAYDHPNLWVSAAGVARISTGRIFVTLWRDDFSVSGSGEAGIVYSDDDGVNWSPWIDLTNGFTQEAYGAGPVVELPDGDLLVTIEGSNSGQAIANRSSHTLRSTDEGVTWGGEVTVRNYVTDTRPYYESRLLLLDNDVLQCHHRTAASSPGTHYVSESTDFGLTWGTPATTVSGYGAPNVIQASTGTLFLVTRQNATADVIIFTSTDRGATWDAGTVLFSTTEMEYGCPLEGLITGQVHVVYGDQPTGSTTNADIDIVLVTEDLSTFAGSGSLQVSDGTTTVDPTTLLSFDPASFDVTDEGAGEALVTFVGSSGTAIPPAILLESGHAVPFTFDEVLQASDGSDWLYASE